MKKGPPIPVRFEEAESRALAELAMQSGLPVAEIIRRCVRLFYRNYRARGIGPALADTATGLTVPTVFSATDEEPLGKVAESPLPTTALPPRKRGK